jgi:hypothetical protein
VQEYVHINKVYTNYMRIMNDQCYIMLYSIFKTLLVKGITENGKFFENICIWTDSKHAIKHFKLSSWTYTVKNDSGETNPHVHWRTYPSLIAWISIFNFKGF